MYHTMTKVRNIIISHRVLSNGYSVPREFLPQPQPIICTYPGDLSSQFRASQISRHSILFDGANICNILGRPAIVAIAKTHYVARAIVCKGMATV